MMALSSVEITNLKDNITGFYVVHDLATKSIVIVDFNSINQNYFSEDIKTIQFQESIDKNLKLCFMFETREDAHTFIYNSFTNGYLATVKRGYSYTFLKGA